jgi:hypothetical protein
VRGVSDEELRGLRDSTTVAAVIPPASDGAFHTRAVAEGLAQLAGAPAPGAGFPESPSPEFPAVSERFNSGLRDLLAGANRSKGLAGSAAHQRRRRGRMNLARTKPQNSSGKIGK